MLYTISIPITDKRTFLTCDTYTIPSSVTIDGFLRSFGKYQTQRLPNYIPMDVKYYATAEKGIRVCTGQDVLRHNKTVVAPRFVFRRIFYNFYTARIDIGIEPKDDEALYSDPRSIFETVSALLECKVFTKHKSHAPKKIREIGKDIAKEYLFATTKDPSHNWKKVNKKWVEASKPMVILECNVKEINTTNLMELNNVSFIESIPTAWGIRLYHCIHQSGISLWIIEKNHSLKKDMLRDLKIYLFRYHQERESLAAITRLIFDNRNKLDGLDGSAIRYYLEYMTRVLSKTKRDGIEQHEIISVIRNDEKTEFVGDIKTLLDEVNRLGIHHLDKRLSFAIRSAFAQI